MTFKPKNNAELKPTTPSVPFDMAGFTIRLTFALLLIGTGGIFLLDNFADGVMHGVWWVMYLLLGAVGLLVGAAVGYLRLGHLNSLGRGFIAFSLLLLVLSVIFIVDPHWTFTRSWQIDLLRGINWDVIWPLLIIVMGVVVLLPLLRRKPE
jgi:Na+/H+-dicarboxylate symporter